MSSPKGKAPPRGQEERNNVLQQMRVRTTLKGDKSWIAKQDESEGRTIELPSSRSRATSFSSPGEAQKARSVNTRAPVGYIIRGVFTKPIDSSSQPQQLFPKANGAPQSPSSPVRVASIGPPRASSSGYKLTTEDYKKLAPYNVRRSSAGPTEEEEEMPFTSDEQRRRSEAASSVLRRTAPREHSYVLSAAKKSASSPTQEPQTPFIAKRVEVVEEAGPSEKRQDSPALARATSALPSSNGGRTKVSSSVCMEHVPGPPSPAGSWEHSRRGEDVHLPITTPQMELHLAAPDLEGARSPSGHKDKEAPSPREPERDLAGEGVFEASDPHSERLHLPAHFAPLLDDRGVHSASSPCHKPGLMATSARREMGRSIPRNGRRGRAVSRRRFSGSYARVDREMARHDHKSAMALPGPALAPAAPPPPPGSESVALPRQRLESRTALSEGGEQKADSKAREAWQGLPATLRGGPASASPQPAGASSLEGPSSPRGPKQLIEAEGHSGRHVRCPTLRTGLGQRLLRASWPAARGLSSRSTPARGLSILAPLSDAPQASAFKERNVLSHSVRLRACAANPNAMRLRIYDSRSLRPSYVRLRAPPFPVASGSAAVPSGKCDSQPYEMAVLGQLGLAGASPAAMPEPASRCAFMESEEQKFATEPGEAPRRDQGDPAAPSLRPVDASGPQRPSSPRGPEQLTELEGHSGSVVGGEDASDVQKKQPPGDGSTPYPASATGRLCTYCRREIGDCPKITLEHLAICCHEYCFQCGVCGKPMGDLLDQIFVHRDTVHCGKCYEKLF
ncbi:zinc finger protein 185 [Orycteropus afer afer]|uniref:Zinc finger protein 185 n=1 Tax=Orycteropus afer afer TaxID=1230840 RepID=A0A8B7BAE6_ORYAF|nr:zinc finger protein 185 [Orycteropus afer afer]